MAFTVFIPTAGTGSRLGDLTKYINKSLVSIENKPTLIRIMDMFPDDTEYVIAVGYKGELVKEFISIACKDKKITIIDVNPYEGEGSGLGYSINCCKKYLQKPFIFCSCDTLVNEKIYELKYNWMGWDDRDNKEQYRTISVKNGKVISINEKKENLKDDPKPYIGLSGIYDYKLFWESMDLNNNIKVLNEGESAGLRNLVKKSEVKAIKFSWYDTGSFNELELTRKHFHDEFGPNILEKPDEAIWFLNNKVIKFSNSEDFIKNRIQRVKELEGYIPRVVDNTKHMYAYNYVDGVVLSKCISLPIFKKLLNDANNFWKKIELDKEEKNNFHETCMKFYKDKTYMRVEKFFDTFKKEDCETTINNIKYPSCKDLLNRIDWKYVSEGLPGRFHGDFHFENILYDDKSDKFIFLDWRQDFGGSLSIGDIYYDLGKLLHGIIMCHELVAKNLFNIIWNENDILYDFNRKQILVQCEEYYYKWLADNGYDVKKVKLMAALIFLNIAALHHYPYSLVLMALGKEMLSKNLED